MPRTRPRPSFSFWLFWLLATIAGWSARRALLGFPEMSNFGSLYWIGFFGNGLVIGVLQWLLLYRYIRVRAAKSLAFGSVWIISSALGWMLAWGLNAVFPALYFFAADSGYSVITINLMAGGVSSLVSGGLQWLVLRARIKRAWLWIPVNMISMVAGMYTHQNIPMLYVTLAWVIGGAVSGAISGLGLLYLFGKKRSTILSLQLAESKARHATPDFR